MKTEVGTVFFRQSNVKLSNFKALTALVLLLVGPNLVAMSPRLAQVATRVKPMSGAQTARQVAAVTGTAAAVAYFAAATKSPEANVRVGLGQMGAASTARVLSRAQAAVATAARPLAVSLGWATPASLVADTLAQAQVDSTAGASSSKVCDRPSNLAKDYPAAFDELQFELVYTKWRQRLDAEEEEIFTEAGFTSAERLLLTNNYESAAWWNALSAVGIERKAIANGHKETAVALSRLHDQFLQPANIQFARLPEKFETTTGHWYPDLEHVDNVKLLKELELLPLSAQQAADLYRLLYLYGLHDKYVLFGSLARPIAKVLATSTLVTRAKAREQRVLYKVGVNVPLIQACGDALDCTVGH
ncbi:MAG TPA: hypothetical protein VJJ83_01070, partial [Candidatus Babeliales bacterium]|nr:hypothetical protein [Candidatus Babeliales bacterium]